VILLQPKGPHIFIVNDYLVKGEGIAIRLDSNAFKLTLLFCQEFIAWLILLPVQPNINIIILHVALTFSKMPTKFWKNCCTSIAEN
jgi:hypothetical protein